MDKSDGNRGPAAALSVVGPQYAVRAQLQMSAHVADLAVRADLCTAAARLGPGP